MEWRRIAIVMVTTENEHNQVVRALAADAHEYLDKTLRRVFLAREVGDTWL
jgi:two-component system chemotaxis response regulator CheY